MRTIYKAFATVLAGAALISCNAGNKGANVSGDDWALTDFGRVSNTPLLGPDSMTRFFCPMRKDSVAWMESDIFNPAATVKGDTIFLLYRAEDNSAKGIGARTSRIGLAYSLDGVNFTYDKDPVVFPAEDSQKRYEWEGGCEDPRVAMTEDGTYVMFYTQWNREVPRLAIATSKDLRHWEKHGPAFSKAYDGRFGDEFSKSASVVTKLDNDGRQVITKVNGKYYMYWGEKFVNLAVSDNLLDWTPMVDERGELLHVMDTRKGYFDSALTECGPPALLTDKGIVLIYNGKNAADENGDPNYVSNTYCGGQALFDASDPTKLVARLDKPFFKPEADFEKSGQYPAGTVFIEGMAHKDGKWYLYYGCADSFVGGAVKSE